MFSRCLYRCFVIPIIHVGRGRLHGLLATFLLTVIAAPAFAGVRQVVPVGTTCDPNTDASFIEQEAECVGTAVQRPAYQFGAAVATCASGTAGLTQWTGSALQHCNGTSWVSVGASSATLGSLTTANPFISGDATSGFYTAGAAKVDVGISGSKVTEWTSSGITVTGIATANSFIPTSSSLPANGMYLPAANTLGFATSGSTALVITSTNSVGIGTTAPTNILSIVSNQATNTTLSIANSDTGPSSRARLVVADGTNLDGFFSYRGNANDVVAGTGISIPFSLWTNNNERVRIDTSGNVGIGTSAPANLLDVVGAVAIGTYAGTAAPANGLIVSGNVGVGTTAPAAPLTVAPPVNETVTAGATITANGCSTLKPVTSTAARATSTTNAFTNSTAAGCCMTVQNVGSFTITIKHSANMKTSNGADISLSSGSFVPVCSDGSIWYQTASLITPA